MFRLGRQKDVRSSFLLMDICAFIGTNTFYTPVPSVFHDELFINVCSVDSGGAGSSQRVVALES